MPQANKKNEFFSCLAKKVPVISGFRQLDDFAHWQTKENPHIPQRNLKITCAITPVTCAIHLFFGDRAASLIVYVFTVNSSCRRSSNDSGIVSVIVKNTDVGLFIIMYLENNKKKDAYKAISGAK